MMSHRLWHHFLYDPEPAWEAERIEDEWRALEDEAREEQQADLPDFDERSPA